MDVVTMTHPRLGTRTVQRDVVRKMRQNGWTVQTEPSKSKQSKETE